MRKWLTLWAAQAASRTERKQRFALIESAYPQQRSTLLRSAGRRPGRVGRLHHSIAGEGCHE